MTRRDAGALALILLVAGVLRVAVTQGIGANDTALYAASAHRLVVGDELPADAYGVRLGLTGPVAIAFWLFGVSDISAALPMLMMSLACVATACWLGYLLQGPGLGLSAAVLVATLPLGIVQGTDLHADLPMALGLNLCFTALLAATRSDGRYRAALLTLAATAIGWAALCKLTALVLIPAVVAAALMLAPRWSAVVAAPLLGLSAFAVQALTFAVTRGDLLYRIRAETAGGLHQVYVRMIYPDAVTNLKAAFLEVPEIILAPYPVVWQSYFGWHGLGTACALALVWRLERGREWRALWLLLALLWLPLSFAITGLDFVPAQIRYARTLEPLVIPMMVILARGLLWLRPTYRVMLVTALAVVGTLSARTIKLDFEFSDGPLRRAHATLRSQYPKAAVISDYSSCLLLRFLDHFDPTLVCEEFGQEPRDGLALVHPANVRVSEVWAGRAAPLWVTEDCSRTTLAHFEARVRYVGRTLARLRDGQHPLELLFALHPAPESTVTLSRLRCRSTSAGPPRL